MWGYTCRERPARKRGGGGRDCRGRRLWRRCRRVKQRESSWRLCPTPFSRPAFRASRSYRLAPFSQVHVYGCVFACVCVFSFFVCLCVGCRCLCMCVCVYVRAYVCLRACVCVRVCVSMSVCTCTRVCTRVRIVCICV